MPELPEVTTIVSGLNKRVKGLIIKDVWTDLPKRQAGLPAGRKVGLRKQDLLTIKNPEYYKNFKKEVAGKKIIVCERIGKNILMHLSGNTTILFHMKMTGHLLCGKWISVKGEKNAWKPENKNSPLCDPYNRFIHIIFYLDNGKMLALSDMRKFAKVTLLKKENEKEFSEIKKIGPDPLKINLKKFRELIRKKPTGKIKQVLMDQELISGIGNIYSDEILWATGIHPLEKIKKITDEKIKMMYETTKKILTESINYGGDSMSDFRNIDGEKGNYQKHHKAYRQTGKPCPKRDGGKIVKTKVGGRSAHYCNVHQSLQHK